MRNIVISVIVLVFTLLLNVACCSDLKDENPLLETAQGRNTLSFVINGKTVKQIEAGGGCIRQYGNKLYSTQKWSYAAFDKDELTGDVMIRALLDHSVYHELRIYIPSDYLRNEACFHPEATLFYLYSPRIVNAILSDSGEKEYEVIDAEYKAATISEASIRIRNWTTTENGIPILAGNFSLSGYYSDTNGNIFPFRIEKGVFDLTDNPYRPRSSHSGGKWGEYE